MAAPHLTAAPNASDKEAGAAGEVYDLGRSVETVAQRIRRLQQEARMLAREQVEALAHDFNVLAERAAEIADGGEAYPAGVRDLASRMATDVPQKVQALLSIMNRASQG
ncbi:MAG: hypothetical protein P4L73_08745 [Caulobacteraceae bacterium]|nr:hypothetical protein [Caulobacteraceae bacterium]